jgi:hypothetical protein
MKTKLLIAAAFAVPALALAGIALSPLPAAAAPKDHCKPRSACICGWEVLDGKQQYVCRVIKAPR